MIANTTPPAPAAAPSATPAAAAPDPAWDLLDRAGLLAARLDSRGAATAVTTAWRAFAGAPAAGSDGAAPADHPAPAALRAALIHPADMPALRGAVEQALAGAGPQSVEFRARHAGGAWRRVVEELVADRDGGILALARDLSPPAASPAASPPADADAATALAAARRFESADVPMAAICPQTRRVLAANGRFRRLVGAAPGELERLSCERLCPPEDILRLVSILRAVVQGELAEVHFEIRLLHLAAPPLWAHCILAMEGNPAGPGARILLRAQDITTRKGEEAELRRTLARHQAVLDQLQTAVYVLSPGGVVVDANVPAQDASGLPRDALLGRRPDSLTPFALDGPARQFLRAACPAAARGEHRATHLRLGFATGRVVHAPCRLTPIPGDDGAVAYLLLTIGEAVSAPPAAGPPAASSPAPSGEAGAGHQARLAAFFDSGIIGMVRADLAGGVLEANDEYLRIIGYTREELLRGEVNWAALTPPQWLPCDERGIAEARVRGVCTPYEKEYRRRDGSRVRVIVAFVITDLVRDEATAFALDVSRRHAAEELARREGESLAVALQAADLGSWDWDLESGAIQWSAGHRKVHGTPDDVPPSYAAWAASLHPEDRPRVEAALHDARSSGEDYVAEYRILRPGGEVRWVAARGRFLRAEDGRAVRMVGILRDDTDRRLAEHALRRSDARFRDLVESLPGAAFSALGDGLLEYCSPRLCEYTGLPQDALLGPGWLAVVHPADRAAAAARWVRCAAQEATFETELRLRAAGGEHRWFILRAVPRRESADGAPPALRWSGVVVDIHERRAAEQELARLVRRLDRSNKELEDFAYIASHDLKEPLRGMRNFASFLLEDHGPSLPDDARRKLETIDRLGKRLADLLSALLYFSQVGRADFALADVDLGLAVADALAPLNPTLAAGGVRVHVEGPFPTLRCDRRRVAELLQALIANAAQYNDKPDKEVRVGVRPASGREPPAVFVRDNGIGIAPRHGDACFRIFRRLHPRDDYGGGVGAGLAIAKKIVERHGGRLWFESTVGEGSTFLFTLQEPTNDDPE